MLDNFLKLLERFVKAHESIAASLGEGRSLNDVVAVKAAAKPAKATAAKVEAKEVKKPASKTENQMSLDSDDEVTEVVSENASNDKLREDIRVMAEHVITGDSDECADELKDLLSEYGLRGILKLKDADVESFHKKLKKIVSRFYEISD